MQQVLEKIKLFLLCHSRNYYKNWLSELFTIKDNCYFLTLTRQYNFNNNNYPTLTHSQTCENSMFSTSTSTANNHNHNYFNKQSDSTGNCYDAPNLYSGGRQNSPSKQANLPIQQIEIEKIAANIENYVPVTQLVDMNSLRKCKRQMKQQVRTNSNQKQRYVIIKKYKQAVFFGQCNHQSKKSGKGIMIYTNGRVYQGNWQDNIKQGKGYEKFNNGSVYSGDYKKGKPQGFGRYSWANGEVYQGQWIDGLKNGSGIWRGSKGDSYIGEWKDGQANGYGVHTWINGDRYQGQFKNCLKHGQGLQKFSNGDSYKGNYQNGKPYGYGQYYWSSGSYFKGNFKNGLREGQGVWKRGPGNSDKYEGQYKDDKKEGQGIFTWANGNVYKGEYANDLRHGYGQMEWSDRTFYRGNWIQGAQQQPISMVSGQNVKNNIVIRVTPKTGREQPSFINDIPSNNDEDFFSFEDRANNYNQPERPAIMEKNRKQFRARGLTSNKTTRQRSVRAETPQSKIYLNNSFNQPPRLNKKYSMESKIQYNGKRRSHSKFSTSSQHNLKINQIKSSSFFMHEIHQDHTSKNHRNNFMHSNSNQSYNYKKHFPDLQNSGIQSGRQIKTSAGVRQKKIADQINYFTNSKLKSPQFF